MTTVAIVVLLGVLAMAALVTDNLRRFRRAPAARTGGAGVSVLIPARDEEIGIETAVRAAGAQHGDVEVIVVDDGSQDRTPEILDRLARELPALRVVRGGALPPGWAGKAWACWQLAALARHDWLLFVDADVRLAPDAVPRALARARREAADFLSGFPRQLTLTVGEALVVPLIHLVLLAYLPLGLARRSPRPALSAGCGQFVLVRRAAYFAADGHRAVRGSLHDGLQLARRLKEVGFTVDVFDASDLATCRMYAGFAATWRGFTRNAYEALGSPPALAAMAMLNLALFVAPFAGLAAALAGAAGAGAIALWALAATVVVGIRAGLAARFSHPWWVPLATPLSVLAMTGIQLHSFVNHVTGRRLVWRARAYAPGSAGRR